MLLTHLVLFHFFDGAGDAGGGGGGTGYEFHRYYAAWLIALATGVLC